MKVLWLPSWYPSKKDAFTGDFIQRHARAVTLQVPVHVIFVVKDDQSSERLSVVRTVTGQLHETIAFFKPVSTGFKPLDRIISILTYKKVSRQLIDEWIVKEGIPTLVHVHVALWAGITAWWIKKKYKVPYLVTEHWTGYDRHAAASAYTKDFIFRYSIKKVLRHATVLLPVSDHLGKLINQNFAFVPYEVVPNVVDTQYFRYQPAEQPACTFIHVSSMNFQKNCEGLLAAFAKVVAKKSSVSLIMVGPAGKNLKLLAEQLGVANNIQWAGEIPYAAVAAEMQRASCLVMFSRYENLPCAVLEALCCGLPVIATRTGGIPELINHGNGVLVASEDADGLAAALLQFAKNDIGYKKAQIAEQACKSFNYAAVGNQVTEVYRKLQAGNI